MLMKFKFKAKALFLLTIVIIFTAAGFFAAYRILRQPSKAVQQWILPDPNHTSKKFITEQLIINSVQHKRELIPLEVDLTQKVTINNSWGNLEMFKKIQNIYFSGKGIYAINMSRLDSQNISIDNDKGSITITIPKPFVKAVVLDEKKTIYETPQNGLLRFGEIEMKPSEYEIMVNAAKGKMSERLNSSEFYDKALKASENAILNIVEAILKDNGKGRYAIQINFEQSN